MKRILVTALAVVLMAVGIVGTASAIEITNDTINTWLWEGKTVSWAMPMPGDFEMPYDEVTSAKMSIYSKYVDPGTNNIVSLVNDLVGFLNKTDSGLPAIDWYYLNNDNNGPDALNLTGYFDIASFITEPWVNGTPLAVSLTMNAYDSPAQWYFVQKAVLTLEYENKTAPVPEPGTMALFGFGMLGLVVYGKRRKNRDA